MHSNIFSHANFLIQLIRCHTIERIQLNITKSFKKTRHMSHSTGSKDQIYDVSLFLGFFFFLLKNFFSSINWHSTLSYNFLIENALNRKGAERGWRLEHTEGGRMVRNGTGFYGTVKGR